MKVWKHANEEIEMKEGN